jgi:uncharacterized protein
MRKLVQLVVFFLLAAGASAAQPRELQLHSAGRGSAFLPYAQGLARHLNAGPAGPVRVVETAGSIANLAMVDADPAIVGFTVLAVAQDAIVGTDFAKDKPHRNVRALFPMYRTSYNAVALAGRDVGRLLDLENRRVGVGPADGPADVLFRILAKEFHLHGERVTGTPAALADALIAGRIDALWLGAIVPLPGIALVTDNADAQVFGLSGWEIASLIERYRYLSPLIVPAGTYRGQTKPFASVAAWNFAIAHKDLDEQRAYEMMRAVLSVPDPVQAIHDYAAETRGPNAANNRVIPFHPGAIRYYREAGIALP